MEALIAHAQSSPLDADQVQSAANALLDADQPEAPKVAFLKALHTRGETPAEIALFVDAFLQHAIIPPLQAGDVSGPMIDVCGTGGDKLDLFNVSTTSIFVLAAGGLTVVKHGNRGITSKSGGADVLEALGVPIDLGPEAFSEVVKAHGVGFLFAQRYHPAFKAVAPVRATLAKEGQKTIFNLLGPLLNPVSPAYQLIGVFDGALPPIYADILKRLGRQEAWAVHGETADGRGVDEISIMGPTAIHRCRAGEDSDSWTITPASLGMEPAALETLQGGDAKTNAGILEGILSGEIRDAKRQMVAANAAAGFTIAGITSTLLDGIALAEECLNNGKALEKLRALQATSA